MGADPRTVGGVLRGRVAEDPTGVFLVCDDERITYEQLFDASTAVAKGLIAAGVTRGTHVGLLLPNNIEFAVTAVAALRIGALLVPISTLSSAVELRSLIDRSDTQVLIASREYRGRRFDELLAEATGLYRASEPPLMTATTPTLRRVFFSGEGDLAFGDDPGWRAAALTNNEVGDEIVEAMEAGVRPADPMVIVHTSGSTSAPKGVVHAHGSLLDHLGVLNELRAYGPGDVLFSNSPFFWIGGFAYTFLGTLVAGATVLCSQEADPSRILDMMERERPTMCNGYAASATALAADPSFPERDLSSMRRGNLYSLMPSDVVPADPALRTNMLGMTEGGSVVLSGTVEEAEKDLPEQLRGSFGRPTPDLEARIVDQTTGADCAVGEKGELWLRGPAMLLGYYGVERDRTFDADGWYHAGDLVHRDADDHWYFHGRGDDMIKTAGANVSPVEVQDAVRSATGLESIAFAVPDPEKGYVVALALLTDEPAPALDQVQTQLRTLLSAYKVPKLMQVMRPAEVPLRSSGKVDVSALRERFGR
jgi:acyl-CoA synthetase (AMP-forming)/AMP-acid ligase II